jgi:Xaa-Pro aminopeptidase
MRARKISPARGVLLAVASLSFSSLQLPAQTAESAVRWQTPDLPAATPIASAEYATRRRLLMETLGEGVFVAIGSPAPPADYLPFQQDPDFRFLTGITEPGAVLILERSSGRLIERLFVQPRDPAREVWESTRMGVEGATAALGIAAQPAQRALHVLDSLLTARDTLFVASPVPDAEDFEENQSYGQQVLSRFLARHNQTTVRSAAAFLARIRARKSTTELDLIRRATYISAAAHREAMRAAWPGMNEFEIRALVEYTFLRNGAEGPAYASIVGSGPNSTTLHYNRDDRFMNDGDLLLMDVGATYAGYAADVTRTVPVNGRFTADQRAIYEVVLSAQKAAERRLRPGATWRELNDAAASEIKSGLSALGLIEGPDATYQCGTSRCPQYRLFFMHGLGHGVGLEVHDPDISTYAAFQPGSAVTIEPGIYVRADVLDRLSDTPENQAMVARLRPVVQRYGGIGVRIEDVYILDERGVERASRGAPREWSEIELLMREASPSSQSRHGEIVNWYLGFPRRK